MGGGGGACAYGAKLGWLLLRGIGGAGCGVGMEFGGVGTVAVVIRCGSGSAVGCGCVWGIWVGCSVGSGCGGQLRLGFFWGCGGMGCRGCLFGGMGSRRCLCIGVVGIDSFSRFFVVPWGVFAPVRTGGRFVGYD